MDVGGDSVQKGSQSFKFDIPVYIEQTASVVGEKESEGPLGRMFDVVIKDPIAGGCSRQASYENIIQKRTDKIYIIGRFVRTAYSDVFWNK